MSLGNTAKCRYNTVLFIPILRTTLRLQWQKVNQMLQSQQTPHISPSRVRYGVSIVRILEKMDRVITAPHCNKNENDDNDNNDYVINMT